MEPARILVVDPHETVRSALCHWLSVELPNVSIAEARNYGEALERVRIDPPDLIIIDILLPGDNGVKGTKQISAILPSVPIVILTMYEDVEYRDQAFQAGATLFIPKRKMFKELIPGIQNQLALMEASF